MKGKIIGFVFGAAMLAAAMPALAATNNVLFDPNGAGNTQVNVNSMVTMHAYIDTTSTQDVESLFVTFPGAGGIAQQGACYTVNPSKIGASPVGGWDVSLPVKVPAAAGVWPVAVTAYGINGDAADTTCSGPAIFGTQNFAARITVTDTNSSGTLTGNSGGSYTPPSTGGTVLTDSQKLDKLIQLLTLMVAAQTPGTTPAPTKPMCPPSGDTFAVQAWLMSHGYESGFYAAGVTSPTGHWGPITSAAYAQASLACK